MKKYLLTFITALTLIFAIALSGCSAETTNTSNTSLSSPTVSETMSDDETPSESSATENPTTSESGSTETPTSSESETGTITPNESGTTENPTSSENSTENPSESNSSSVSQETNSSESSSGDETTTPSPSIPEKTEYKVTLQENIDGGTVTAPASALNGDTVTLTNTPSLGYKFVSYAVTDANNNTVKVEDGKFTMPASSVTVTATFTKIGYGVSVNQPAGGTITASTDTAYYNDTVTLGNSASTGYGFTSYAVKDANGNPVEVKDGKFTMPASSVTVTASFTQIDYSITVTQPSNGTITVNKTTAHYGDTITLGNTPKDGYNFTSYTVNGKAQTTNTFTMPASNVTVSGTFTIKTCSVTVTQPTGGTIKANNSTSFTVNYGTEITLTNSATAGYIFSSYKVNNTSQTSNKYTVKSNTTITGVFNKGIGGLSASSFTGKSNSDSGATGSLTINGATATSTQNKYPFVYSKVQGDFYYEVEISLTSVYDNDPYPKAGIGIECNNETLFFYIDALPNGYEGQGFGTNKYTMCKTGSGSFSGLINWCWDGNSITGGKWFGANYVNGNYVKLSVLRIGGLYRFFVDGAYALSVWMPNMDDTALVGVHSFNIGFNAKNAKVGTGNAVANNARAYYNLNSSKNPTSVTIDGQDQDWGENLVNQYGMATADGSKYFFASAFKGADGVYVMYKAKTLNFINDFSGEWWENTNIELFSGSSHIYANAKGEKSGITDFHFGAYCYDNSPYKLISVEAKIPYSVWNASNSSAGISISFAFKSNDSAQLNFINNDDKWWCGADWRQISVTTTGLNLTRETTPTEKVIKLSSFGGADPYILLAGDQYFMYATTGVRQGFRVYVSDDLYNWRNPTTADFTKWGVTPNTEQKEGWCFHVNWSKSIANNGLWAPEVKYNSTTKKYVMFYSGGTVINGNTVPKSGVATSDTPLGPFIDANNGTPMIYATDNNVASIDATCFLDTDGQAYMFYSKDCSWNYIENYHNGQGCNVSQTWGVKLNSSWTGITGTPVLISTPEQDWEFSDGGTWFWNEGPFVYKQNGKYFLTYSANNYGGENYGVGLAISSSPLGTYKKYEGNPIVTKEAGKTTGTGHGMMFTDKNGKMWYTFHTYLDLTDVAYNKARVPLIARMWFHNGIPTIEYKNW